MDLSDTSAIHGDSEDQYSPNKEESDFEDEEEKADSDDERLKRIRAQNKAGPLFINLERGERERNVKEPRRLIKKSGKYNVSRHEESQVRDKYLRDFCNTLVHSRWRWTIIAASSSFILTWLIFGVIWMLVSNANGDSLLEDNGLKCIIGVSGFAGYFMLSLETQTTIGYGGRSLNDHCPEVLFVVCLQIIFGVGICGLTVNIVYIKMTKSQHRYSKLFSKYAVIYRRDGALCLIFRVRDEDSRHAIGTSITAYILRKDRETDEPYLENIMLEPYGFLIWPLEIVHKITPSSPLWDISSYNLLSDKFEVIVTLQGTSPTTAQCSKTRTSYINSEILWGHKFKNCVKYLKKEESYTVNQKLFNQTQESSTHLCSAKRFTEVFDSLSPTPNSRNYRYKLNIMYNGTQRRPTLMSIETYEGSSSKTDEQSVNSKEGKIKAIDDEKEKEKFTENEPSKDLERPTTLNLAPAPKTFSSRKLNKSKPEIITEHQPDPYDKEWDYQNYTENHLPDFWLNGAASLPLINNYNQDQSFKTRKFGSHLENMRIKSLHAPVENLNESKGDFLRPHRVFEGEEFVFDSNASADESNMSLVSTDFPKSDMNSDRYHDLDALLKTLETFLQEQTADSENKIRSSRSFPNS